MLKFIESHHIIPQKIGNANSYLISVRELVDFAVPIIDEAAKTYQSQSEDVPPNESAIKLDPIAIQDCPTLLNLGRFYAYDMSEFFGEEPGWEMEDDGLYGFGIDYKKYLEDQSTSAFFIRYKNELAGFAIIDKDPIDPNAEFNMAQFFISRTYKRMGLGKIAAFQCFGKCKGRWEVHVMPKNITAYHFWRSIISEYTHANFIEKILKNKNNEDRIVFLFSNP